MNNQISFDEFAVILQETFDRGQDLTFTPSGRSMLPMLDGKEDKVTFSPKPDRLKKFDVAFYRRANGQLVLHRVVGFRDGAYVFSGDGQYFYEYGVRDGDVLAIMTSFTHKGRLHRVDEPGYRLYIRAMMLKKRMHILAAKIYHRFFPHRSQ